MGKKFVVISGLALSDNNRGTAALSYGALSFLEKYHGLNGKLLLQIHPDNLPFRKIVTEKINVQGKDLKIVHVPVWRFITGLFSRLGILLPYTRLAKFWDNVEYVAAINGGDGFSDIYGTALFHMRLWEMKWAMKTNIPIIQLPQTIGPFNEEENFKLAKTILQYSKKVYVRDLQFAERLQWLNISYELKRDLSYYMKPEPFDVDIKEGAIGINISGLAYSNKFKSLTGQFDNYPYLCEKIIEYFQRLNKPIYLISHSYNYFVPEVFNDDLQSIQEFYDHLRDKSNVYVIHQNLNSPNTKYLISKMTFFIGTRMHANFAAIFTGVPVFGLAYSFKFQGAFEANGLYNQTAMINNITQAQADCIVEQIAEIYRKYE